MTVPTIDLSLLGPRDPYQWAPIEWEEWDEESQQTQEWQGILLEVWGVNGKYFATTQVGHGKHRFWVHKLHSGQIRPDSCPKQLGTLEEARSSLFSVAMPPLSPTGVLERIALAINSLNQGITVHRSDIY